MRTVQVKTFVLRSPILRRDPELTIGFGDLSTDDELREPIRASASALTTKRHGQLSILH